MWSAARSQRGLKDVPDNDGQPRSRSGSDDKEPLQREAPLVPAMPAPCDPRVAAVLRGERRAAESLLAELLPRARNLIRYLVRGDGEVDDLTQEALIAVLRGLPTFRGEGSLRAWADRVVVRSALATMKRVRRERALKVALKEDDGAARSERPDDYAARRQLVRALDQLPDEQRLALVLHHVLGMSVPEVAEDLGAPFETIRSRLRLGKASLAALMEAGGDRSSGKGVG